MAKRCLRTLVILGSLTVIWMLAWANGAYAQGELATATLTGRIADKTRAVIPGTQLSLQSKGGGVPLTTTFDKDGYCRFSLPGPGTSPASEPSCSRPKPNYWKTLCSDPWDKEKPPLPHEALGD